jgi:hypothetical protein
MPLFSYTKKQGHICALACMAMNILLNHRRVNEVLIRLFAFAFIH